MVENERMASRLLPTRSDLQGCVAKCPSVEGIALRAEIELPSTKGLRASRVRKVGGMMKTSYCQGAAVDNK